MYVRTLIQTWRRICYKLLRIKGLCSDGGMPSWTHDPMLGSGLFAQVFVGKVQKHPPVLGGHRMLARPNVVAEPALDQFPEFRHVRRCEPFDAEKSIDGIGRLQHCELTIRVRP